MLLSSMLPPGHVATLHASPTYEYVAVRCPSRYCNPFPCPSCASHHIVSNSIPCSPLLRLKVEDAPLRCGAAAVLRGTAQHPDLVIPPPRLSGMSFRLIRLSDTTVGDVFTSLRACLRRMLVSLFCYHDLTEWSVCLRGPTSCNACAKNRTDSPFSSARVSVRLDWTQHSTATTCSFLDCCLLSR